MEPLTISLLHLAAKQNGRVHIFIMNGKESERNTDEKGEEGGREPWEQKELGKERDKSDRKASMEGPEVKERV